MKRFVLFTLLSLSLQERIHAQATGAAVSTTGKAAAPVDLTGYWVSVVTEDWRWRMVTPLKGDAASIPINAQARKIVDAWDPAKDEAAGLQCKAYGAPAVMRLPGRLHITWQDDNTLKIETDAGIQARLFRFGGQAPAHGPVSWQGYSAAQWIPEEAPGGGLGVRRAANPPRSLEVVTTELRPGYLRRNGVPYSDKTVLTEYYDRFTEPGGNEWFTVTTVVTDPMYLGSPFVTTTDFKKQSDASGWNPRPCSAR
ncbi:MAG: hypothetical protein ABSG13_24980 [Bryobacteraceae bacterium]|jgi:hypothetical protein